jgi:hypothetical protein
MYSIRLRQERVKPLLQFLTSKSPILAKDSSRPYKGQIKDRIQISLHFLPFIDYIKKRGNP